ncbi:MAG: hypothetical protein ACXV3F_02250 [Frankiaceae bacterium]
MVFPFVGSEDEAQRGRPHPRTAASAYVDAMVGESSGSQVLIAVAFRGSTLWAAVVEVPTAHRG